jgi:endonuclease YncB( thermonuclease family)
MHRLGRAGLAFVLLAGSAPLLAAANLPFVEDDYARALAEARARKLPLFIEAWAPW